LETERPDAHFHDPHARTLAGTRGELLWQQFPGRDFTAASCTVRTNLLDRVLLETCRTAAVDLVLNLGAGLDTRPYRLPLSPTLRWIEVDTCGVLEYKASKLEGLPVACIRESLPADLGDARALQELLDRIGTRGQRVLVMTEGLLVYLTRDLVASMACELYAR